jgi:hypothetical protein
VVSYGVVGLFFCGAIFLLVMDFSVSLVHSKCKMVMEMISLNYSKQQHFRSMKLRKYS